jgi:hypothetical protein
LNQEYAVVDTGHFVGLTLQETLKSNLSKSRDEFISEMNQAEEVDKQVDEAMSNIKDNIALSPKTQARMLMRSKMQPTSY